MVAALLHLQPTSARSAQCRSRREVPVSFDQLPLCGPQCCSSSLATTALAYKRLRRARKAHYAPPSFPTCRCKLRYFSQSLEPQAKSYRPGRRTRRTCRRAGAGRSHPRRAAQHAGAATSGAHPLGSTRGPTCARAAFPPQQKQYCPLLCSRLRVPRHELQHTCVLATAEAQGVYLAACRPRAGTGRPLGDALVCAGAAQGAPGG